MEGEFPHGMNALDQGGYQRHNYGGVSNFSPQYQEPYQPGAHTLPPIQAPRPPLNHAPTSYDQSASRQAYLYPSYSTSFSPYPVGATQSPHFQGMPQYQSHPLSNPNYGQQQALDPNMKSISPRSDLPNLRPVPGNNSDQSDALQQSISPSGMPARGFGGPSGADSQRIHVVGSQGRRGILPSDETRPSSIAAEGASPTKPSTVPLKDSDGKFPCPHCQKTYLHAKHLKRHMLRHTGDRPYTCVLCNDTFSRSDILKRHFQKCSIRRGNPTGATHLSSSQSHLKKQAAKKTPVTGAGAAGFPTTQDQSSNYSRMSLGENEFALGIGASSNPNVPDGGRRFSDRNVAPDGALISDSKSSFGRPNLHPVSVQNQQSSLPSSGSSTPLTAKEPGHFPPIFSSDAPRRTNSSITEPHHEGAKESLPQMPLQAPDGNYPEWSSRDDSSHSSAYPGDHSRQNSSSTVKAKAPYASMQDGHHDEFSGGFFGHPRTGTENLQGLSGWSTPDTVQFVADRLTSFCQLDESNDSDDQIMRYCLLAENIEHFIQKAANFLSHWPSVHLQTLNPPETSPSLVLAMVAVGAVYSDRLTVPHARAVLRVAAAIVKSTIGIFGSLCHLRRGSVEEKNEESESEKVMQLEAFGLVAGVTLWHGDDQQRQEIMDDFPVFVKHARTMKLFELAPQESKAYSPLHQRKSMNEVKYKEWDWSRWIQQEQRIRFCMQWYLLDAALVLYFNTTPNIDPLEISLPLPADDAAWEATTDYECAWALGLLETHSDWADISGSRNRKQSDMNLVLLALRHPSVELPLCSTNVYSKFILIHAIIVWICQYQRAKMAVSSQYYPPSHNGNWSSRGSAQSSESITANTDSSTPGEKLQSTNMLNSITTALSKWKEMWDSDKALQFPVGTARLGFCRDGIVFYWLAQLFVQNRQPEDFQRPWRERFDQTMSLLKEVTSRVAADHASRGEKIGSVGDIDEQYGIEDLTRDVKLLFRPLDSSLGTPVTAVAVAAATADVVNFGAGQV